MAVPKIEFDELKMQYDRLHADFLSIRSDLYALREENAMLKEKLDLKKFGFRTVKNNVKRLKFFTGLQSLVVFQCLLGIFKQNVSLVRKTLNFEDHLLLMLLKVRLGNSNRDIAYRFQIPVSVVSKILRSHLPILSKIMKPLIKWPSKQDVLKSMPNVFRKKFRKCRCIIDCSEIFIDRPSNLAARAQTWSNYKHNNTIKYLVAITPAGAISFLSQGWGGRVSDKEITVKSGFLENIETGDEVLADRDFLVRDELASCGATLRMPYFTKGKKQMSPSEVDTSRQLSRVRIHVESYRKMEK